MKISRQSGFTLIEVIVSVSIFALIMTAMSFLFSSLYRQQGTDMAMIKKIGDVNLAVDKMTWEIRGANRGENGNFALAVTNENALTLYSDVDGDSLMEKISYALAGGNLGRTVVEPGAAYDYSGAGISSIVCTDIQNGADPIFTYYDDTYDGTGSPLADINVMDVKVIGITLRVNSNSGTYSYPLYIQTKVQLRNLK